MALKGLSAALMEQRDFDRAIETQHRLIGIKQATLGNQHPSIRQDLAQLGAIYSASNDFHAAGDAYRQALFIAERHLDARDPELGQLLYSVANAYQLQARAKPRTDMQLLKQALPLYERALKNMTATSFSMTRQSLKIVLSELAQLRMEISQNNRRTQDETQVSAITGLH